MSCEKAKGNGGPGSGEGREAFEKDTAFDLSLELWERLRYAETENGDKEACLLTHGILLRSPN